MNDWVKRLNTVEHVFVGVRKLLAVETTTTANVGAFEVPLGSPLRSSPQSDVDEIVDKIRRILSGS